MYKYHIPIPDWKLKLNESKTQVIILQHKMRSTLLRPTGHMVKIEDTPIRWTKTVNYLGITIDQKLLFRDHVQNERTCRSQHLPKCGAPGGLKVHFSFGLQNSTISFSWSTSFSALSSSRDAPTKLVPRTLMISSGNPRLAINLRIAIMHDAVLRECAISRCTALVVRQVNITPQRFSTRLPTATRNGPK